jgi:hypothetical protein
MRVILRAFPGKFHSGTGITFDIPDDASPLYYEGSVEGSFLYCLVPGVEEAAQDIVERLRQMASPDGLTVTTTDLIEAADEIESLRAELLANDGVLREQ